MSTPNPEKSSGEATRPRVLVVEDDAATREGIDALLREQGIAVETACNGNEALAYLKSAGQPLLILLDLTMPGMSGWEFRRRQRADPSLADIPVVVMTAQDVHGESVTSLEADGHLQKPVRPDELRGVVDRFRRSSNAHESG
jgi:CheY-like chemotaxis protein